jgi:hypothetical protein
VPGNRAGVRVAGNLKRHLSLVVLVAAVAVLPGASPASAAASETIVAGFSNRDGGPATSAWLETPTYMLRRPDGSILISETARIRRVATDQTISTFAGTDYYGYWGDGGQAVDAGVVPAGMAALSDGSILIADTTNSYRIRKIDPKGIISTIAGSGAFTYPVTCSACGDGGPAVQAEVTPSDIEVGTDGSIYIISNGRIRRIAPDNNIYAFAGNGFVYSGDNGPALNAGMSPSGMVFDAAGNLFVADSQNHRIRKIDAGGTITTYAGTGSKGFAGDGGPAATAQFDTPIDLAIASDGSLLVVDEGNRRVRRISTGGTVSTVAGAGGSHLDFGGLGGPATAAHLGSVRNVMAGPSNSFYVAGRDIVRFVDPAGIITAFAGGGVGDGGPATLATLGSELDLATDRHGNLFISDSGMNRIRKVSPAGTITTIGGTGNYSLCSNCGAGQQATTVPISDPRSIAVDAAGNVFVGTFTTLSKIAPDGTLSHIALDCAGVEGMAVDREGNVFVAEYSANRVRKVAPDGAVTLVAGNGTNGFSGDGGPAVNAQLSNPRSVAVDRLGNVYIGDTYRVRKVTPGGTISTIAGDGTGGSSGDGGPAAAATIEPWDLSADADGNLLIADGFHNHIRRIDRAGTISTVWTVNGAWATAITPSGAVFATDRNDRRVVRVDGIAKPAHRVSDFDGDWDTDRSVYRNGAWFTENQATAFLGTASDLPVPGDYDGDGDTDRAVYRDGAWHTLSQSTAFLGLAGDMPVPGDYDGDGATDRAIFRPAVGGWHVEGQSPAYFGLPSDVPVPGDYDGDGDTERAVFRPSVGGWYVDGQPTAFLGLPGDIPVPGDYDGDGDTERAVFRPSVGGWYVEGLPTVFVGLSGDVPVPGDYNGDGDVERAIFRPAVGGWYVDGLPTAFLGFSGDIPLALPQAIYRPFFAP